MFGLGTNNTYSYVLIICINKKGDSNHIWYERADEGNSFFFIFYGMKSMPLLLAREKVLHRRTVVAFQEKLRRRLPFILHGMTCTKIAFH